MAVVKGTSLIYCDKFVQTHGQRVWKFYVFHIWTTILQSTTKISSYDNLLLSATWNIYCIFQSRKTSYQCEYQSAVSS